MVIELTDYEIGFVPVPKAASTVIKAALATLAGQAVAAETYHALHRRLPTRRFKADRFKETAHLYRMTLVRDPIERLLAVYADLIDTRGILRDKSYFSGGKAMLPTDPDPDFFFQNLSAYRSWVPIIKHQSFKQVMFTGADMSAYDRVYTLDQFEELGMDLGFMTGRNVALEKRQQPSNTTLRFDDLAPQTRDALRVETAPDYAAFDGILARAA